MIGEASDIPRSSTFHFDLGGTRAAQDHRGGGGTAGYHGRFVIVVDDDIDPYNLEQVVSDCHPLRSGDIPGCLPQDLELQDRSAATQA
jgi:hypothetical protein